MPGTALTLGNFDGVHRGHAAILAAARQAVGADGRVVAVTFDPAPVDILRPGSGPPQLLTPGERVAALEAAGADAVDVVRPDTDLLNQSPREFIGGLVERHAPGYVLEGPDFRFGRRRAGDNKTLAALGGELGFIASVVPRLHAPLSGWWSAPVSSSLCRWLVGRGRMRDAASCLGRPHRLTAEVVRGEQRGRTIRIPTANLDPAALAGRLIPRDGVYAATAHVADDSMASSSGFPAAVSIGIKPTFGAAQLTVEAHLIGADHLGADDLYGRTLSLDFHRFARDQFRYDRVDALVEQLHRDIAWCRAVVSA